MRCDTLWRNARLARMIGPGLGVVETGMVACARGRIVYAGTEAEAPALSVATEVDCEGRWITPGLIDCHTHLVFAGDRAGEFERRLAGATYEDIARAGGGILATVKATRRATVEQLAAYSAPRLDQLMAEGATTIEVKSGYGLELTSELCQLEAIRALAASRPVTLVATLLAAHALPPEFSDDADGYIEFVCREIIPAVAAQGLAEAVDAFCETIGFTPVQVARVFEAARAHGLKVKLHAEQLSNQHGGALAARFGALSADHLEHLDEAGVAAMAEAGTVATLLPAAFYFMRETRVPPIAALRAAGVPMALASDCNPGTAPVTSLLAVLNMAATLFRLTVEECLMGVTAHAARALGRAGVAGVLAPGAWCDLAIWDIEQPAELVYWLGRNPLHRRVWRGA
jgi:imidazolonepropionase